MKNMIAASALLLAVGTAYADQPAGELVLTNGDRLEGTLVKMSRKDITWKSASFGNVTIAKTKVANVVFQEPVKIQGESQPCTIAGIEDHQLMYRCGDNPQTLSTELLALRAVELYSQAPVNKADYKGRLSVAGDFQRGNTVKDDLEVKTGISYRKGDFRNVLDFEYDSVSTNDSPAVEDYDLTYRLDWFFDELWFWYNQARWEALETANIDNRYTLGSGLGYQVWDNPEKSLAFESGFDYVKEYPATVVATPSDESSEERISWRLATDLRYKLPYSAELFHTNEFLMSVDDTADWEVGADIGISVPLGPGLYSEWKLEYDYDNTPVAGADKEDTKVTVGVGYQW